MFQRLLELSTLLPAEGPLPKLAEPIRLPYDRGLALCFDRQGAFAGVKRWTRHEEIVYRSGPSNGCDLTPCSRFGGNAEKTLPRIGRSAAKVASLRKGGLALGTGSRAFWEAVAHTLKRPTKALLAEVKAALASPDIDKDHRAYLFVARLSGTRVEPACSWPECREILAAEFLDGIGKGSCNARGRCHVCDRGEIDVFGRFSVLACYNLDKPGTIAGGFDVKRAWRNLGVCADCAVDLARSVSWAEGHLRGRAAGIDYLVLPYTTSSELRGFLLEKLQRGKVGFSIHAGRDPLADVAERDLLSLAAELAREGQEADLAFHFVFFREEKASWRILGEARRVLPSRLAAIQKVVRRLQEDPLLATGRDEKPFTMSSWTLRRFTGREGKESERVLRDWLSALFESRLLDRAAFFHSVVSALLERQRDEPDSATFTAREAWAVARFALEAGLVKGEDSMQPEFPKSLYGSWCQRHAGFFTRPEHVAAFLSGCFASMVCYVQRKARGAEPFAKKFRGRPVEPALLRRLYTEGRDRLEAYDGMGLAHDLDQDLAEALLGSSGVWSLSTDETTFAFTAGFALQPRIARRAGSEGADAPESAQEETR